MPRISRWGNRWGNVVGQFAEKERIRICVYQIQERVRVDIFDDIDVSYNRSAATVTREASVYLAGSEQIICEQRSGKMKSYQAQLRTCSGAKQLGFARPDKGRILSYCYDVTSQVCMLKILFISRLETSRRWHCNRKAGVAKGECSRWIEELSCGGCVQQRPEVNLNSKSKNPAIRQGFQKKWCPDSESNQGHGDFQSPALPTELSGQRGALNLILASASTLFPAAPCECLFIALALAVRGGCVCQRRAAH